MIKEQAIEKGYSWRDQEVHQRATTLVHDQLPDHIKDVPDSILNEVIGCAHTSLLRQSASSPRKSALGCNEQCTQAFRIIPQELKFYRKMNVPLPRLCPYCRHHQRRSERNPIALWHRSCQCAGRTSDLRPTTNDQYKNTIDHFHKNEHCPNEFETTYSPERQEIVYCEKCYQAEIL